MIDVCRNDRAAAGDFAPHKFGRDGISDCRLPIADGFGAGMAEAQIVARDFRAVRRGADTVRAQAPALPKISRPRFLANRDEFHLGRDDAASGVHASCVTGSTSRAESSERERDAELRREFYGSLTL